MIVGEGRFDAARTRALRHYLIIGQSSGALVLVLAAALVFHGLTGSPRPLLYIVSGLLLSGIGISFVRFFRRVSTRQQWIQHHCPPITMYVRMASGQATNECIMDVYDEKGEFPESAHLYQFSFQPQAWDSSLFAVPVLAAVYFDPERGQPTLIETDHGFLWGSI
ncbi:MAG: hypothetical protein WC824_05455 [Bacteroidota bacterium]|jgi:hypothetical protein